MGFYGSVTQRNILVQYGQNYPITSLGLSLKTSDTLESIPRNVKKVREGIQIAAKRVGRDPSVIQLVAATKTVSTSRLIEAYEAGIRIFGENRLQEAQEKIGTFGSREGVSWHFIGRMQRRKLKDIVGKFSLLHSVESVRQASQINTMAEKVGCQQGVLLQVNVAKETSKGGFTPHELERSIGELDQLSFLAIRGLMTIPPWVDNPEEARPYFQQLCLLRDRIAQQSLSTIQMEELSMGMSHDYHVAIEEGATMVRIGTALFGARRLLN